MLKLVLPLLLVGSNAFGGERCYVATDLKYMRATIWDENRQTSKVENVVSASLKIEVGSPMFEGTVATLDVQTASGLKGSSLSGFSSEFQRYQVECDGGNMSAVEEFEGQRLVKAYQLRADMEGCDGTMDISTAGTRFNEVACEAPRAN